MKKYKKALEIKNNNLYIKNADCLEFLDEIPSKSVDLILTDPPFGLGESVFDNKYYAREDEKVVDGYIEAPKDISYEDWCYKWISKFDRILKPNGSVMIFSGWTNEADIQYAVRRTKKFKMINHLIWQYSFGVNTTKKFVSSHYHILYFCKNKGKPYFNQYAYHNEDHNVKGCGSEVYKDLQDVIKINKEYKPDKIKNCNTLPTKLIEKLIKHTTKSGDVVLDIFSGGFTTQFAAIKLKRLAWGCELNKQSCELFFPKLLNFKDFYISDEDINGYEKSKKLSNQGKFLSEIEKRNIIDEYSKIFGTERQKIDLLSAKFQRGYWSIKKIIQHLKSF